MRVVISKVIYDSTASASHLRHGLDAQGRALDTQLSILAGNYATAWSMRAICEQALLIINVK